MEVTVDDRGVTRRGLWRAIEIRWDEIRDYRLTIRDIAAAGGGKHPLWLGLALSSDDKRIAFDGKSDEVARVVGRILRRIREPLVGQARSALADRGFAQLGPLRLAGDGVQWGRQPTCRLDAVEAIEIFDSQPAELRVMVHQQKRPYGRARTAEIPNLLAVFQLGEELGYPLRGRRLLESIVDFGATSS